MTKVLGLVGHRLSSWGKPYIDKINNHEQN